MTLTMEDNMNLGWFLLGLFMGTLFGIFTVAILQMGSQKSSFFLESPEACQSPGSFLNSPTAETRET